MFSINTEIPSFYIFFIVCFALAFTFLLYRLKFTWNKGLNTILAICRFFIWAGVGLLLLKPFYHDIERFFEKPVFIISIDNSISVGEALDKTKKNIKPQLTELLQQLTSNGYEVEVRDAEDNLLYDLDSFQFDLNYSNLSRQLKTSIQRQQGRNIAGVFLVSDGIVNQGVSPIYHQYTVPVHTLGLGDSTTKQDIILKSLIHNSIAYLDNKFPVIAQIKNIGFNQKNTKIKISQNGKTILSKDISFSQNEGFTEIEFLLDAKSTGVQHYICAIESLAGEENTQNNSQHIYIEILESKQNILIAGANPHPDIKAIKSALESNKNYSIDLYIPNLGKQPNLKDKKYDVVIFHQIPNIKRVSQSLFYEAEKLKIPVLFILGTQSDVRSLDQKLPDIKLNANPYNIDRVTGYINPDFQLFSISDEINNTLEGLPPLYSPFGNYEANQQNHTLLFQQVGSVKTKKSLLHFTQKEASKIAILAGEGLWTWRMHAYLKSNSFENFDEIIGKTIQYLSAKQDKRRFKVYPLQKTFSPDEAVTFETEIFNSIYEPITGQSVQLKLSKEEGEVKSYEYLNNTKGVGYRISGLKPGKYNYTASMLLEGKKVYSKGVFTVQNSNLEGLNAQADFSLLRKISKQSGGKFVTPQNIDDLSAHLIENKSAEIIHLQESNKELINWKWLLFSILTLITFEWVVRKVFSGI